MAQCNFQSPSERHPGINSLKKHIYNHFWFPKLITLIENVIKQCHLCQMFSNKTTKKLIQLVHTSNCLWGNVSVDLFGPIPDTNHVLVLHGSDSHVGSHIGSYIGP